jgi:hypothetical protein
VSQRADEPLRAISWQNRIGVKGDDVANIFEFLKVAPLPGKSRVVLAEQKLIELVQFTALALVAHPFILGRIP